MNLYANIYIQMTGKIYIEVLKVLSLYYVVIANLFFIFFTVGFMPNVGLKLRTLRLSHMLY